MILRSLKSKMALVVSLLIIFFLGAMTLFVDHYFADQIRKTITDVQWALVSEIASRLDDQIGLVQSQMEDLAEGLRPQDLADRSAARSFLNAEKDMARLFDRGLVLLTPGGRLLAGTGTGQGMPEGFAGREFFRRTLATGRPVVSGPDRSLDPEGHPVVMFTVPVFDSGGRLAAVLGGGLDLLGDNFLTRAGRIRLGREGYISLVDADHRVVFHPDPDRIGERYELPGRNPLYDRAVQGAEGIGETVTVRGRAVLTSYKRLSVIDWLVVGQYPLAEAYAPVDQARRYALIATAAAALLSIALIWFSMGYLTAPLQQLIGHIRRLSEKACAVMPLPIRTQDETGELTEAFNRQMARLCQADQELRKLTRVVEQSPTAILITDTEGTIEYVNPAFSEVTGYLPEEVLGKNPRLLKSGELPTHVYRELWETIRAGREWRGEFHNKRKDGSLFWSEATIAPITDESGQITHFVGEQEDITGRKRMEESLRQSERFARETLDALSAHIAIVDEAGTIIAVNRAWRDFAAENPPATGNVCEGANYLAVCDSARGEGEEDARAFAKGIRDVLGGVREEYRLEYPCHSPVERRWFVGRVTPFHGSAKVVVAHENITERKMAELQLLEMAQHDVLTGLPNRLLLSDRLEQALAQARRHDRQAGVLFLDIDHFKQINDTHGHKVGDELLRAFGRRLRKWVRATDTVARLGGDEFIVVVVEVDSSNDVAEVARKIIAGMQEPFALSGETLPVTTSIGIAVFPSDGQEGETLLKNADRALYDAKRQGRNRLHFFRR